MGIAAPSYNQLYIFELLSLSFILFIVFTTSILIVLMKDLIIEKFISRKKYKFNKRTILFILTIWIILFILSFFYWNFIFQETEDPTPSNYFLQPTSISIP